MTIIGFTGVEPEVLEILGENPALPYSRIADKVGVTRERVRQIARRNGYPPRCGVLKPKICPQCGITFYTRSVYCSCDCSYKARKKRIIISCYQCGKPMERTPGNMRSKTGKYFCDRSCYRKWAAQNRLKATKSKENIVGDCSYEVERAREIVNALHVGDLHKCAP